MKRKKLCRKCGEPITGYGFICDTCVFRPMDEDRRGQKHIFRASEEVEDDMAYVRKLFNLPPEDAPVPSATLHDWLKKRCLTRKTCDDWAGLNALHRDFTAYQGHEFTPAAFQCAVEKAGYAIDHGMVSRLVLQGDYDAAMQVRS